MADLTCSFPGCDRHPSKGDTVLRISKKGPGEKFVGRCAEHFGPGGDVRAATDEAVVRAALGEGDNHE